MARKIEVTLVDDIDGEAVAAEEINFALDGSQYAIDLSQKNAAKLRAAMQPFIDRARKTGRAPRKTGPQRAARDDLDAIRAWAKTVGKKVADRGRIAIAIQDEYDAAMTKPATKAVVKKLPAKAETVPAPAFSSS